MSRSITIEREEIKELTVVGKNIPFIDASEMTRGRTVYASDTSLPGMLEGGLLRSPHPHAKIINIDISSAEQLPGVKAIITRKNIPNVKFGSTIQDDTVLAIDKVRHFGEPVAGVAALDEDIVEEALSLIRVEYEEIPAVFDA